MGRRRLSVWNQHLIDTQIALALAYRGLGMLPAQRAAAERALALDRRNGEALMIIGDSYAISPSLRCPGDPQPERAEQRFREALAIDPLTSGRISLTTHLWWMNRQTEAHQNMVEGLSIQPGNVQLKLWSPFNMAFAGRAEEAFGLWRSGLENPQQLRPLDAFIAGIIDLKRREFETADDYLRRAGSQITEALPFSLILAVTQFQAGRISEGATSLQRGLERRFGLPGVVRSRTGVCPIQGCSGRARGACTCPWNLTVCFSARRSRAAFRPKAGHPRSGPSDEVGRPAEGRPVSAAREPRPQNTARRSRGE